MPRRLWMTADTARDSPVGPALDGQPAWACLALQLLSERAAGASSFWAPYISCLPQAPDLPMLWPDSDKALLVGTQLGAAVAGYDAYCSDAWASLSPVLSSRPALFPPAVFNEDAWKWAFATLRCRCLRPLDGGEAVALVPGLDLLNHSSAADAPPVLVLSEPSGGLFGSGAVVGAGAAHVVSRPHEIGEQLLGCYGDALSDAQTALDWGFVFGSPAFSLQLSLPPDDRFLDDKADVLDVARVAQSPTFSLRPGSPPPADLRAFLRLIQLSGTDAFLLEPLFRDTAWATLNDPVSLANETAALSGAVEGIREALEGYPNGASLRDDEAALRDPSLSKRTALALSVRCGEKRALLAAAEAFSDALASAPRLEFYQERRLRSLKLLDDDGRCVETRGGGRGARVV